MTMHALTTALGSPAAEGILAGLAGWSVRGAMVLAVTALAAVLLRRRSAALRHAVWAAGLAGFMFVPLLAGLAPDWRLEVLPAIAPTAANLASGPAAASGGPALRTWFERAQPLRAGGASGTRSDSAPASLPGGIALALTAWLAGVALGALRLAISHRRLGRWIRRARPVTDPSWNAELAAASAAVGFGGHVALGESAEIEVPIACGYLRSRVLLPSTDRALDPATRRGVLVHELSHLRRGDLWWQLVARTVRVVFWFHPLVWLADRRLRAESEHACDDAVLRSGERASGYAETLLAFASGRSEPAPALAFVGREGLERRIDAVLEPRCERRALSRGARMAVAVVAAALGLAIAIPELAPAQAGRADDTERRTAAVLRERGAPVEIRSATVRVQPAVKLKTTGKALGPEVKLDAPALEIVNRHDRAAVAVLVRFETRNVSRDLMWEEVSIPAGGTALLALDRALWSQQTTRAFAEHFTVSIAAARFDDGTEWWGTELGRGAPDEPLPGAPVLARPAPDAPSRERTPEAVAPATPAPDLVLAPGPPYDDWPSERTNAHPVHVWTTAGCPVSIEHAFTPAVFEAEEDRDPMTTLPYLTLHNLTDRRIIGVKLRFKADRESHAVTFANQPIEPRSALRFHRETTIRGRPQEMTAQVVGVRFEDGGTWGQLDSRIDAREVRVRVNEF